MQIHEMGFGSSGIKNVAVWIYKTLATSCHSGINEIGVVLGPRTCLNL